MTDEKHPNDAWYWIDEAEQLTPEEIEKALRCMLPVEVGKNGVVALHQGRMMPAEDMAAFRKVLNEGKF